MAETAADRPIGHIAGLDTWRALLMLGGVLLHGTLTLEVRPVFTLIELVSHSFRMGAFFAISGFLAGITLSRRDPRAWLRRRMVQIGLPMLFGLAVVCPVTGWLLRCHAVMRGFALAPVYDWYHIWFLVGLLLYSVMAVAVDRLDRRHRLIARIFAPCCAGTAPLLPLLLAVGGVSFALMLATSSLVSAVAAPARLASALQWRLIAGYAPMYLFGFALARTCGLRDATLADWKPAARLLLLVGIGYCAWFGAGVWLLAPMWQAEANELVCLAGAALCPPAAFALIFRGAMAMRRVPWLLARLADASLTIYLLHLPVLVAIHLLLARHGWGPYPAYVVAVVSAVALCLAIHRLVIRRSPWLSLLVNGRIGAASPVAALALPAGSANAAATPRDIADAT